ncbi:MAG TPA: hypothetical protein VEK57_29665 [Thermoanaerobaculia bacterium]|nr:hypothetical protein [Thermoanaerobaculia bacterium]
MTGPGVMRIRGTFTQGHAFDFIEGEPVQLPSELVEGHELVLRVVRKGVAGWHVRTGDLLTVELRPGGKAATGELVLVRLGETAWLGRWWNKGGRRALLDVRMQTVVEGPHVKIFGVVILVTRAEDTERRRRSGK